MKAKIAILGCGNPARQWHLPTLSELSKRGEIDFVALCDMDEKLAAENGARFGVPHYLSLEEMLDRHKDILVVEQTCNDVSVVAGVFLARRGREVVPGYVEWAQRGEGRTGDHPKGAPTNAHLLCCRLSTYARYAFEATPRIWTLVDALTRHYKSVRPLVVDVVAGDPTHHVLGRMVAEHGKHVMVEKPMAVTLPCCDIIIEACRRNGVHFEVAENYFRWPKQRMIVKLIQEGILGDIVRVCFSEPKRQDPFEAKVTHSGLSRPIHGFGRSSGMCMDMGAHRLSQLRLYAQSEPTQITGTVRKYRSDPRSIHEDWAHAMIDFQSGAVGIYETSRLGETQRYCQITGSLGGILDRNPHGPEIPLRLLDDEGWKDIPVETQRRKIDGVDVLQRIVVHTDPEIVYENPFRDFAINDWCVGHASEIMSIANAALNDEPAEYGIEGRKDVEMAMAIYESSLKGTTPVKLPLEGITTYEQTVHEDYLEKFGHPIDQF